MADSFGLSLPAFDTSGLENMAREQARRARNLDDAATTQLRQAANAVDALVEELDRFEKAIDPSEEVRIVIIGGPAGTMLFPETIMALGADRVLFSGVDQDQCKVVVMQHVSQLNVMFKAARVGEARARRIGFHSLDE